MSDKVYTTEYFKKMGRRGGNQTKKKYGIEHFKKMRQIISQEQAEKEEKDEKVDKLA